jgi:Flp pilus assembly pilin Flp
MRRILIKLQSESGQTLAEVGLILAFVATICILAITALGVIISAPFVDVVAGF